MAGAGLKQPPRMLVWVPAAESRGSGVETLPEFKILQEKEGMGKRKYMKRLCPCAGREGQDRGPLT